VTKYWVAVASAEHVRLGRSQGFMQVNHGKLPPLRRIHSGDYVAYYSPTTVMRQPDGLQSLTAIGVVNPAEPYQASMHGGKFLPWRRDVDWITGRETPIRPLLETLEFTRGKTGWGSQMRFGLFEISANDMQTIADAMETAHSISPGSTP
jgi:hypothetical protein